MFNKYSKLVVTFVGFGEKFVNYDCTKDLFQVGLLEVTLQWEKV